MKKAIWLVIAICTLISLTACGDSTAPGKSQPPTKSGVSESIPADDTSEVSDEPQGLFNMNATLAETVLVDEGGVKITATGLTYTAYSVELGLTIENNSGKDLSFVSGSLGYSCNSVNGYMVDEGYLNCDVANGKKANDTISFSYDALMLYGINEIADMEIGFDISDDDYNSTYSGPRQLKTSAFESHDYEPDYYQEAITSGAAMNTYGYEMVHFSQDAFYDRNGVKLRSSAVLKNRDGETALLLELENTTDSMVYVSTSDIGINGLVVSSSTWSSDSINPNKRRIVEVDLASVFDPACWSVYGITDVGSVSLSLGQRNTEGVEIAVETPVEIAVPGVSSTFDKSGNEVYNSNGLRIVTKTVLEDTSDYSADLYVLLLAENNSGKPLTIDDSYDSLSVNGFMTDYSFYSQELADGECAALEIRLWESSLEENQIASLSDIQEIELGFEIKEGYTTIDEPTLVLMFEE